MCLSVLQTNTIAVDSMKMVSGRCGSWPDRLSVQYIHYSKREGWGERDGVKEPYRPVIGMGVKRQVTDTGSKVIIEDRKCVSVLCHY